MIKTFNLVPMTSPLASGPGPRSKESSFGCSFCLPNDDDKFSYLRL